MTGIVWFNVNIVGLINEVTQHRAGLLLGWVTDRWHTAIVGEEIASSVQQ